VANYNDILRKYGLDNTTPSPSSYDDILNKYGVKPTPSATLGDFTVEQSAPKVWDPEQRANLMSTPATVQGAANQFVDRTQSAMGGLVSAAAGGAQQVYDRSLAPALSLIGMAGGNRPSFENVNQAVSGTLGGIEQAGTDVARAEMRSSSTAREEALAAGANELGMDFLTALGDVGIQLGSTLATRNPALGAGVAAAQVYGPDYARRLEDGMSKEDAAKGALARSGVEVGTTIPALGVLGRMFGQGGEQVAGRIVNTLENSASGRAVLGATAEGTQEATANLVGAGVDYGLGYSDKQFGDIGEALKEGGIGAAVGAAIGAMSPGRSRVPTIQTGIPVADAAAQATADIQAQAGVSVDAVESTQEPVTATTPATPTGSQDNAVQSVTERPTGSVPRSEKMRARLNLGTGQLETEGGLPVNAPSAADFERAEMATGINLSNNRQQERARQRGIDVDGLLNNTVAPQATVVADSATPPVLQNVIPLAETAAVEAPAPQGVAQPEAPNVNEGRPAGETPSNSNYIRRAMQLANEEGIDATPEWLQQRVSQLQNEDVSEMAIRGGVSPSTLSYYTTAEEIPQEYRNTTPPPENQLPVVNAIKTATNAREAVDALRPLIQSKPLQDFADKIGKYIDLAEIPVITVNPEDAGRADLGPANYLTAKGKERTVGAYSPATREVYLKGEGWKNNGMNAEALLHELQHAASVHVYDAVKKGTITDENAIKAVADIEALASEFNANSEAFASFPKETMDRLRYAATNPKEFMAITQTSPLVQQALKKEGLWKRFVNAIRGMFGYSRSELPLLERILTAGDAVMGAQQQAQLATAPPAAGTVVNEADYAPGDLTFDEMAVQSQSTRERLREEEAQRSAKHYEDTRSGLKKLKRISTWTRGMDRPLARAQEDAVTQKAALGVPEREIAARADRVHAIIAKNKLDSKQAMSDVDKILRGQPAPNANPEIAAEARRVRKMIDQEQTALLQALTPDDPRSTPENIDKIYDSIGSYLTRSYQRSYYRPGLVEKALTRGKEGGAWTRMMKKNEPKLYKELVRYVDEAVVNVLDNINKASDYQLSTIADQLGVNTTNADIAVAKGQLARAKESLKSWDASGKKNVRVRAARERNITEAQTNLDDVRTRVKGALTAERSKYGSAEILRNYIIESISAVSPESPIKAVRQAARDEGILEKRQDIPEVIRKWWGENTDPMTVAAITFDKIGTLVAETKMLNNIASNGLGVYVFDENNPAPSGESLVKLNNAKLGPLNGKLVREELKQFLDTQIGLTELKSTDDWKEMGAALYNNAIVRPGGWAKGSATVLSWPTMVANVISNTILTGNDLLVMSLLAKTNPSSKYKDYTFGNMMRASVNDALASVSNSAAAKDVELRRSLVAEGILRDGISLGELRGTVNRLERKLRTESSTTAYGKYTGKLAQLRDTAGDAFADLYQFSDNSARLAAFSTNLANLELVYPDLNRKEIIQMAKDRARDTVPTFYRANPAVRAWSKLAGNFATWTSEVGRTYTNRYKYGLNDVLEGYKTGNKRAVQFGFAQMMSASTSIAASSLLIPMLLKLVGLASGDDEQEEKVQSLAPDHLQDKNLNISEIDRENKRIFVWNTSRVDPAAPFGEIANRIENDGVALPAFLSYIRDSMLMPGMYAEGLGTAATGWSRPSQSLFGDQRWREVEGKDRFRPVVEAFVPGTIKQANRAVTQYERGSDLATQISRFIGVPLEEIDVPRSIQNKVYSYGNNERQIDESLKKDLSSPDPLSEDDFKTILSEYLVDSQTNFSELQNSLQAGRDLVGMKDDELRAILKDVPSATNRGERSRLLSGEYRPRAFASDWLSGLEERALRENVRDPAYAEQVKQEFRQRRRWLNEYLGSPRKWQPLLENDNGS